MGYESRFYIVEKSELSPTDNNGLRWADVVAMFDMSKVRYISNIIRNTCPKTNVYIYGDDGEKIVENAYGEPINEISIPDMINILETAPDEIKTYIRYKPFLELLKGFNSSQWGYNLVVLHYGY